MFNMTFEGYEDAREYLIKLGFTQEKLRDLDGFSTVGIANDCLKEGRRVSGILPDGTFF